MPRPSPPAQAVRSRPSSALGHIAETSKLAIPALSVHARPLLATTLEGVLTYWRQTLKAGSADNTLIHDPAEMADCKMFEARGAVDLAGYSPDPIAVQRAVPPQRVAVRQELWAGQSGGDEGAGNDAKGAGPGF